MAFRAPRYNWIHAAREVGAAAISVSDTAHTDYPKDNLIDDRASTLFKWSAGVTNPWIKVDLGFGPVSVNRLIIPRDHNVSSLYIDQADDLAFTTNREDLHYSSGTPDTSPVAGVQYDSGNFSVKPSDRRYIRLTIVGGPTQFYLPQLVFTTAFAPAIGPNLTDARDERRANVTRLIQSTGLSPTVQNGPTQRVLEYVYEYPLSSTDLTTMEAMIASVGMTHPFWVDPASWSGTPATDDPPVWMKFAEMPNSRIVSAIPVTGVREKTFSLSLIESLD